jgi:hypothetical protein
MTLRGLLVCKCLDCAECVAKEQEKEKETDANL